MDCAQTCAHTHEDTHLHAHIHVRMIVGMCNTHDYKLVSYVYMDLFSYLHPSWCFVWPSRSLPNLLRNFPVRPSIAAPSGRKTCCEQNAWRASRIRRPEPLRCGEAPDESQMGAVLLQPDHGTLHQMRILFTFPTWSPKLSFSVVLDNSKTPDMVA